MINLPNTHNFCSQFSFRTDSTSPRRRSSTTNLNTLGRRSSSLTPNHVNSGSALNIHNNNNINNNNKVITSPNSRSASSQQLQVGSNKARALYAKQGSAALLMQNAQANSSGSLIPTTPSLLAKTASKPSVSEIICLKYESW